MSQTIDSKVVEMKFDNSDFEKNVEESLQTLKRLESKIDKLDETSGNFSKIGKAVESLNFLKLDKALDTITDRFSTMGRVGTAVIEDLTRSGLNLVKTFGSNVWNTTFGQIKSGGKSRAQNIEQSKFLLEGMKVNFEDVQSSIDNAVTDTAFGFDEAAMAAAQLSGASVQLGEDMDRALLAISGVAAMTNRSYSDIADIFVDSAAAGKVAGDAFNRLSERGLAAKNVMMDFYGVTADELDKLAKKGMISFNDFAQAMYDAFGDQAKKSNSTLTGVLANTRAALSRMGQTFYQPLMANDSDVVKMLQSLKDRLKDLKKYTDPVAEAMSNYVLKLSRWAKGILDSIDVSKFEPLSKGLTKTFENLTYAAENLYTNILKPFFKYVKDALIEVFPSLNTGKTLIETIADKLVDLSGRFRKFTADIGIFGEKGFALKEVLKSVFSLLKVILELFKGFRTILGPVIKLLGSLGKVLVNSIGQIGWYLSGALKNIPSTIQVGSQIVAGIVTGILSGAVSIVGAVITLGKIILNEFLKFFIIKSPSKLMKTLVGVQIAAGIAAGIILGKEKIIEAINEISSVISHGFTKLIEIIFVPLDMIVDKLSEYLQIIGNSQIIRPIMSLFELIDTILSKLTQTVKALDDAGFSKFMDEIKALVLTILTLITVNKLADTINAFGKGIESIGSSVKKAAKSISEGIKDWARSKVLARLGDIFTGLAALVLSITGSVLLMSEAFAHPEYFGNIKAGLITIGSILAIIAGIVITFGMLNAKVEGFGDGLKDTALVIVGISGSIWLVGSALKKVGRLDWTQIGMAFLGIIGLFTVMAIAMAKIEKYADKSGNVNYKDKFLYVMSFGLTISLIAGAIKKISLLALFSPEALTRATVAIGAMVGIFGAIAFGMEAISKLKFGEIGNFAIKELPMTFIAMGFAVKMIASAIKKLSKIEQKDLDMAFDKIEAVMLLLALIVGLAHFAQAAISKLLFSVAATVAACGLFIKYIGAIENMDEVNNGFKQLGKLAVGLLVFTAAVQLINKKIGGGDSDLKTLLYISALVVACGGIIKVIGELSVKNPDAAKAGFTALVGILGSITLFMFLIQKITRATTQLTKTDLLNLNKKKPIIDKITQFGELIAMIKTLVNAVVKVSLAMAVVGKLLKEPEEFVRALIMLGVAVSAVAVLLYAIDKVNTSDGENIKGVSKVIATLTGMILVISGAAMILSNMPLGGVIATFAGMVGVMAVLALVLHNAKTFEDYESIDPKPIWALTAFVAAIGACVAAIMVFTDSGDFANIIASFGGLAACLLALAATFKILSSVKFEAGQIKSLMAAAGAISLASLSLVVIAGSLAFLAMQNWEGIRVAMENMVPVIATLGAVLAMLTGLALATEGISAGIIIAIAGAFDIMSLSLIIAAGAFKIFAEAVATYITPTVAQNIVDFFSTIVGSVPGFIELLCESIKQGVEILRAYVPVLEEELNNLVNEISDALLRLSETVDERGQEVAKSFGEAINNIKQAFKDAISPTEMESVGADFVGGFATGISSNASLVIKPAAAVGLMALLGLRSKEGIDSHSDSKKTIEVGHDFVGGLITGIIEMFKPSENAGAALGTKVLSGLQNVLSSSLTSTMPGVQNGLSSFTTILQGMLGGAVTKSAGAVDTSEFSIFGFENGEKTGLGFWDGLKSTFSSETVGNLKDTLSNIFEDLDIDALKNGEVNELLNSFLQNGISLDSLSGDGLQTLINQLKESGIAGDALIAILQKLGLSVEDINKLGLDLGTDEAKKGVEETKKSVEGLADEIIKGKFGNAPVRWDNMFDHLIKAGLTAQEAYSAIADAQNEVNKRLGSSVVHSAEEMEKKVSASAKKASNAASEANKKKSSNPYGSDDYYKETSKTGATINTLKAEQQVTAELQKQVAAEYDRLVTAGRIVDVNDRNLAVARLKANEERLANDQLTKDAKARLESENENYKAVVNTYNEQSKMRDIIKVNTDATKEGTEAQKKQTEEVKNTQKAASGIKYGSKEYDAMGGGKTINSMPTREAAKTAAEPVKVETKVEVEPKVEVKKVDTTDLKEQVVTTIENDMKALQTKVEVTPKIDTSKAEASMAEFKRKTEELGKTIPETFKGISDEVSKFLSTIAATINQNGSKISSTTKQVFQNAVNEAVAVLNGEGTIGRFVSAGKSASQGYANGIKANLKLVKDAGQQLGNAAITSTKKTTKTKSPSRVFFALGTYNGEGYANGMTKSIGIVEAATSKMANASVDVARRAVYSIASAVDEGMDLSPTITPVIDAGTIQNGIRTIDTTLSQNHTTAIAANVEAKASYDNAQMEAMQAQMDSMKSSFDNVAEMLSTPTPVIVDNKVELLGDADGVFKLMQQSNSRYTKMHGKSAFA